MLNLKAPWVRLSAGLMVGAILLWASGIAPQAYNLIIGGGTPAARGSTLSLPNTASVSWSCSTAGIITTCLATASGGGGTGGGIVTYSSGAAITPLGTQYIAIGGGGQASATEADVEIGAPSAATISSMFVNFDLPPGTGNSIAVTWRKNGSDQTLTCTVSGSADTCSDTTHSFAVIQDDLLDIKLVTTGSVIVAPGLTIATAYGTTGTAGYLTVQNNGTPLPQEPVLNLINGTNSTYVCADNPGNTSTDCQVNATGGSGSGQGWPFTFTAPPLCAATTHVNFNPSPATTACFSAPGYLTLQQTTGTNNGDVTLVTVNEIASTFTFTVALNTQLFQSAGFNEWGIAVYDGTKVIEFGIQYQGGSSPSMLISQFNNVSSFNTSPVTKSNTYYTWTPNLWLQIQEDGTNRTYRLSADGINFFQFYQEAQTTFLTTTQYGIDVRNTSNTNQITQVEAVSWKATNP